ncbi:nuclease A inhibitor family protein [Moorena sp. SIO3B2]|uniref:nuclease A inhibitor family protein n=1 Tax=Moorena sp. SIO3B2 TaxID=2607827 RepID=UPI00257C5347|nr:nuclease A inhibitor family protein [Moorena sp. SIO3B2]
MKKPRWQYNSTVHSPLPPMTDLLSQLNSVIDNLYWLSASDELWELLTLDEEPTAEVIAKLSGKAPVKTRDFETFFLNATTEQDWHGQEDREDVKRYKDLVKLLQENLEAIVIYTAGEAEADVFVTGLAESEQWIALKTMEVES